MRRQGAVDIRQHLLDRVEFDTNGGCWLWPRAYKGPGYGLMSDPKTRKMQQAHRVSYREFVGDPGALFVCHKCDVPACCNPDHLFLGTGVENMVDMARKGRSRARLNRDQVIDIRRRLNAGEALHALAREYGVSAPSIHAIKTRENWAWLEDVA